MKGHRSNNSYNSRLTRWLDRLLLFDFIIEHISGAKMGPVDYFSRQPNQKAKVTKNMMRKLRLQKIPASVTRMQQFTKIPQRKTFNHSSLTA